VVGALPCCSAQVHFSSSKSESGDTVPSVHCRQLAHCHGHATATECREAALLHECIIHSGLRNHNRCGPHVKRTVASNESSKASTWLVKEGRANQQYPAVQTLQRATCEQQITKPVVCAAHLAQHMQAPDEDKQCRA
jgi:hypothetical protein